jgi:TPP-dependent 2-oxoacid decarboxylase
MINKSKKILTEISAGELLDKISILEIKLDKIKDKESLIEINKEYTSLSETKNSNISITKDLENLTKQLKETNTKLWSIEDEKRMCEKNKDFGKKFIELARSVYLNNDKRAKIKSEINKLLGSNIKEIKKYINY